MVSVLLVIGEFRDLVIIYFYSSPQMTIIFTKIVECNSDRYKCRLSMTIVTGYHYFVGRRNFF